ncbi:MAG: energy-coupling factor ABC transporter permease [Acidimicrobiales bacterium]
MHAPDGFLSPQVAVATALLSAIIVGLALRATGRELGERQIPLAGMAAAFIFAAQMFNFPVASGTTGHLLGGALAAILLGPRLGAVVVTVVVVVQALLFADGGITALGYNVLNMAIVPAFGGWALFRLIRSALPATPAAVTAATALAAGSSVVLSAMAFSLQWLFGATAPVPFDTVFGAMVGVHVLIGIGEGLISALTVAAVLAARPDLVVGAAGVVPAEPADGPRVGFRAFAIGGVLVSLFVGAVVSQFAAGDPDGLERVAIDEGFVDAGDDHALSGSLFADYATRGIGDEGLSLAVAGTVGVTLTLVVGYGLATASRGVDSGLPSR